MQFLEMFVVMATRYMKNNLIFEMLVPRNIQTSFTQLGTND